MCENKTDVCLKWFQNKLFFFQMTTTSPLPPNLMWKYLLWSTLPRNILGREFWKTYFRPAKLKHYKATIRSMCLILKYLRYGQYVAKKKIHCGLGSEEKPYFLHWLVWNCFHKHAQELHQGRLVHYKGNKNHDSQQMTLSHQWKA